MKITKELLKHLKVKSISLKNEDKNTLCFLERIEKGLFTFTLPQKIVFKQKTAAFELTFDISKTQIESETCEFAANIKDFGEDWLSVEINQENSSETFSKFIRELTELEKKYEVFGRRKENRVKIGKEKSKEFGLSELEQSIFIQSSKFMQPCVVLDASIHGICVITTATPQIRDEENFCIKLSFVKPEQTIILKAHKVYSKLTKTENKTFATFSCQLLEPIHFAWKERVIKIIEESATLK